MPATHTRRSLPVAVMASGFELALDVLTIAGAITGPRVGVSAMIHGDELDGALILRDLWRTLDPAALRGTVELMPVANPLAMEGVSRNTPIDMLDMNRVFPGQQAGWLSEQQAHVIAHEYIDHLDVLIDIHCGGTFPWVDYCYVVNDEALSRAFLSELLYKPAQLYAGTGAGYASSRGVRTVVVEIGGGYHDQSTHVANGVRGVLNVLRHVGALEGAEESRAGQLLMHDMTVMRPRNGGLCIPRRALRPGERLDGAVPLADIVSPYSFETLETMSAPYARNVVVLTRNVATRIHPGDYGFMIGDLDTATSY